MKGSNDAVQTFSGLGPVEHVWQAGSFALIGKYFFNILKAHQRVTIIAILWFNMKSALPPIYFHVARLTKERRNTVKVALEALEE